MKMSNELQYQKVKKGIHCSIDSVSYKPSEQLKYENKLRKTLFYFHYVMVKLFLFSILLLASNQRNLQEIDSFIILKTIGAGDITILSNEFFTKNNLIEVQLNDNSTNISYQYDLNCSENQTNTFKITFNKTLNSTSQMFSGCDKIIEIDFSNFDSSNITEMNDMFLNCSSLISLDLSNLNIAGNKINASIFRGCERLEYINLKNLELIDSNFFPFSSLPNNSIICFDNDVHINLTLNNITMKVNCIKNDTSNDNIEGGLYYMNYSEIIFNNKHICKLCGKNLYLENNTSGNIHEINCSYPSKADEIETTMAKQTEQAEQIALIEQTERTEQITLIEQTERTEQTILIEQTERTDQTTLIEQTEGTDQTTLIEHTEQTDQTTPVEQTEQAEQTKLVEQTEQNETEQTGQIRFNPILEYLILNGLNLTNINISKDKQISYEGKLISFTSTLYQKKNEKHDNITIDLGECEENLRKDNNISTNDSLYILSVTKPETGMKIPKVEYEVYYSSDGINNFQKLNLSQSCKDTKVEISIKVKLDDTIDKYDPKSDYYNNRCSKVTSSFGTDITLEDRRNEFVDNNMFICEEMCNVIYFNKDTEKVKCSCDVKLNLPSLEDIQFDKEEFIHNFIDTNNFSNLSVMKCYKIVMIIKELIHNYGFYIMSFIILFYFITLSIFIS